MLNLTNREKEPTLTHQPASAVTLPSPAPSTVSSMDKTGTAIISLSQARLAATEPGSEETVPSRLTRAVAFLHLYPKLSVLISALAIATASLGVWIGALYLENKVLKIRISQQQQAVQAENADAIKSRIDEAKNQMSQLQNQMEQQQTDTLLTEQASLAGENARLLQDLNQLSKPQFGAPLVMLEAASVKLAADPTKKDQPTIVDIPFDYALFTVVLQQTPTLQEKGFQSYFVELRNPKEKGVTWSEKLLKAASPNIPLTFARRALAAGKYQLKLYGLVGKKKELVEQYDMQVNYLPDPALKPAKKAAKKK